MKPSDLRQSSDTELRDLLAEQTQLLTTLKYNHALSPVENPARIQQIRRDVARIKTLIAERARGAAPVSAQ